MTCESRTASPSAAMPGSASISSVDLLARSERPRSLARARDEVVQDDLAELERQAAALDLCHDEEVFDEPEEPRRVPVDHVEVVALVVGQVLLFEQLGVAADRRERGAQLVRDETEELVLDRLRRFELADGGAQLLGLVAELDGLLVHLPDGAGAPRGEHEAEEAEQQADGAAADQDAERIPVAERVHRGRHRARADRPAVVEVGRERLGVTGCLACAERGS